MAKGGKRIPANGEEGNDFKIEGGKRDHGGNLVKKVE